jgi:hypothetical protein
MPAQFDNFSVKFQYPENWSLDIEDGAEDVSVSVASPGGAFWSVSIHPEGSDLDALAATVLGVYQKEFTDLDFESASDEIDQRRLAGYDVHFYCLDFLNTAVIRGFKTTRAAYILLCQAEDSEFERFEPVVRAITISLLRDQAENGL